MDTKDYRKIWFGERRPDKSIIETIPEWDENLVIDKQDNSLLEVIYAPDERTGLPNGDIAFYMSKKTSPEVRQFIIDNLMRPVDHVDGIQLSEEDSLFDMVRQREETQEQYISRMQKYVESQFKTD